MTHTPENRVRVMEKVLRGMKASRTSIDSGKAMEKETSIRT